MKKSISRDVNATNDYCKIASEDLDLKINDKNEDPAHFELESKIETQEEEPNNEREESLNERKSESIRSIKTIESLNSKYIGEVNERNLKDGLGVSYHKNGDKYIGQFKDGKKNGIGKFILVNGEVFQGEFKNDTLEGYLEHIGKNGIKQGYAKKYQFISGAIEINKGNNYSTIEGIFDVANDNLGMGKMINNKKRLSYSGEMSSFISNGLGSSIVKDKFTYQGNHVNGKFTGYGEVFNPDGSKFFGFFNNNLRNGYSLAICKDGRMSFGKYINDIKTGPFIVSTKGVQRLELWNNGFKSKLIEKMDSAKTYIKNYYPEYDWINKVNFKNISDIYIDIQCSEYKEQIAPPIINKASIERVEESKTKEIISNIIAENPEKDKLEVQASITLPKKNEINDLEEIDDI